MVVAICVSPASILSWKVAFQLSLITTVTWTTADFCTVTEDKILIAYAAFCPLEQILSV